MASVYTLDELKFMRKLAFQNAEKRCESNLPWNARGLGWIGGLRYGAIEDQTFKMIYDNTDIKKELWVKGEPSCPDGCDDPNENCVELRCFSNDSLRLNDFYCYHKFNYFCKKQLAENVPETTQSTPIQPDKGKIP